MTDILQDTLNWIAENRAWMFSGIGAAIITTVLAFLTRRSSPAAQRVESGHTSRNIQASRGVNISMASTPAGHAEAKDILEKLQRQMGDLLGVLRLRLKRYPFVREFFILSSSKIVLGPVTQPRFRLNADEIPDLVGKVRVLERHGLVRDVRRGSTPIYRMSEALMDYLTGQDQGHRDAVRRRHSALP